MHSVCAYVIERQLTSIFVKLTNLWSHTLRVPPCKPQLADAVPIQLSGCNLDHCGATDGRTVCCDCRGSNGTTILCWTGRSYLPGELCRITAECCRSLQGLSRCIS
eukprot:COSAG06_NODE_3768_length_4927_cov_3.657208_3_plen_105_part_01